MAFTDDDKIVIEFLRQNKHYGTKRFISEFPEKRWSLKRFTNAASRTRLNYGNVSSLHGMNSISASSILQSVSGALLSVLAALTTSLGKLFHTGIILTAKLSERAFILESGSASLRE